MIFVLMWVVMVMLLAVTAVLGFDSLEVAYIVECLVWQFSVATIYVSQVDSEVNRGLEGATVLATLDSLAKTFGKVTLHSTA